MLRAHPVVVILASAGVVLLGACSSGGSKAANPGPAPTASTLAPLPPTKVLTKPELIQRADEICGHFATQRDQEISALNLDNIDDVHVVATNLLDKVVPIQRAELNSLRALTPPVADRAAVEKIWDEVDTGTNDIVDNLQHDPDKVLDDASSYDPYTQSAKDARAYGFTKCGSATD